MTNQNSLALPQKIHLAVNLLYGVVALGLTRAIINIIRHADVRSIGFTHLGHALIFAGSAYLIYMVSKRRNWARISLLLILAIDIPFAILPMFDSISHSLLNNSLGFVQAALFIVAMVLLYLPESRIWFSHEQDP